MASEVLQKGSSPTTPVTKDELRRFYGLGNRSARAGVAKIEAALEAADPTQDNKRVEYGGNVGSSVDKATGIDFFKK